MAVYHFTFAFPHEENFFPTKEYFITLLYTFMQINYIVINSQSQLCEKKGGRKKYRCREKIKIR